MFRADFAVYAFALSVVSAPLPQLVCGSASDPLLESYRLCLADRRGGPYWHDSDVNGISCKFISTDGAREVSCEWAGGGHVRTTYQLDPNATLPPPRLPNCGLVRRVEIANDATSEIFSADLDNSVKRLPTLIRAPRKYKDWRYWIDWTSPLRITVEKVSPDQGLPSFSDFNSLRSFSLTHSPEFFRTNTSLFPDLPSTVEEMSLARNNLISIDFLNNTSFLSLKRLDLSHNKLNGDTPVDLLTAVAPYLEEVDISHNALAHMLEPMRKLCTQLKTLDVSHNSIPGFVWKFNPENYTFNLRFLNFSYNTQMMQYSFPFGLGYPYLETLDVSYSKPLETWEISGPKLKRLYASGFDNIHIVGNLNLEYVRMKMDYYNFPIISNCSIKHLDLSGGKIRQMSNMGLNNTTVKYLDISMNEINQWTSENIFGTGVPWVKHVNFSYNKIRFMSSPMLLSLQTLKSVDLRENPYECNNCTTYYFQIWLKKNTEKLFTLNNSNMSPQCGSPEELRHIHILENDFYQKYCFDNTALLTGVSIGVVCLLLIAQGYVFYHFRFKIIFMYHMYRLRIRQTNDNPKNCTHDVFICYSSLDRAFVMNTLAPLIEDGPEKYKAYIHERSFILGCHIETNIVEAIEKSRRALLVVSQAFLTSEFCKREYDMVTHRAFDGDRGYMVLLRLGPLRKETLPRPLRLYMTTKTYLEWPDDPSQLQAMEVRHRLVNALGKSLHQRAQKGTCEEQTKKKRQSENNEATDHFTETVSYQNQEHLHR